MSDEAADNALLSSRLGSPRRSHTYLLVTSQKQTNHPYRPGWRKYHRIDSLRHAGWLLKYLRSRLRATACDCDCDFGSPLANTTEKGIYGWVRVWVWVWRVRHRPKTRKPRKRKRKGHRLQALAVGLAYARQPSQPRSQYCIFRCNTTRRYILYYGVSSFPPDCLLKLAPPIEILISSCYVAFQINPRVYKLSHVESIPMISCSCLADKRGG